MSSSDQPNDTKDRMRNNQQIQSQSCEQNQHQCCPSNYCTYCNTSCNRFCNTSPCCNVYLVTTIACKLFSCLNANEIAILAANLNMLGDSLVALQTQQDICCPCPNPEDSNNAIGSLSNAGTDQSNSDNSNSDSINNPDNSNFDSVNDPDNSNFGSGIPEI